MKKLKFVIAIILILLIGIFFYFRFMPVEHKIIWEYKKYMWDEEKTSNYEYVCSQGPDISEAHFEYLKLARRLYFVRTFCVHRLYHGPDGLPNFIAYEIDGKVVLRPLYQYASGSIDVHFSEAFNPLDSENALLEYIDLAEYLKLKTIDEIDASLFSLYEIPIEDCAVSNEAPSVKQVVTKDEKGFIYEGFYLNEVGRVDVSYYKYFISFTGEITKVEELMIADCGPGIEY